MRLPIRARLTLLFAALMAAVLAVAGLFIYGSFRAQLDSVIRERITAFANELAADLQDGESTVLHDFGEGETRGFFAQVVGDQGATVESKGTADEPLLKFSELQKVRVGNVLTKSVRAADDAEARPAMLTAVPAPDGRSVVVGKTLTERDASLQQLSMLLWFVGPALCLVTSALAWLLAGAALRPVESLRQQASLITEGDLSRRLPVPETGDEIATLAKTVNNMLSRLEQAFERERRFVDDASHELRTPLGILKAELDLALRRARTKEELEAAVKSTAEESDRLNRLAEDLLVLARADRGKLPLHRETVSAANLLRDAASGLESKAHDRAVSLAVSAPENLNVAVDPMRMRQALSNLIANALAHSPRNGKIEIAALNGDGKDVVFAVADTGGGFPEAFIAKAFDPFARADAGRSRGDGDAGLGLAIVKSIVEAHGGSASAMNRPAGGAIVTLRIPQ